MKELLCVSTVFFSLATLHSGIARAEKDEWNYDYKEAKKIARKSGKPIMTGAASAPSGHAEHEGEDAEIVGQIKELLDTRVRPAVAQDGGDITFHGFERGVVYLHMQGACAGCPSSTITLKMGIENLLRHYIPEVTEVRPVGV